MDAVIEGPREFMLALFNIQGNDQAVFCFWVGKFSDQSIMQKFGVSVTLLVCQLKKLQTSKIDISGKIVTEINSFVLHAYRENERLPSVLSFTS